MNWVQAQLAKVAGVSDVLNQQGDQITTLQRGYEEVVGTAALLERQLEDLSYINLWEVNWFTEVIPTAKRKEVINRLRRLRHENPLAKQAIKLSLRFTFGKGVQWTVEDEQAQEIINAFWNDPTNQTVLTSHEAMKDRFDETLTDGEKFFVMFGDENPPYVRLSEIPMEQVVDIIYHPQNWRVPVWYKRQWNELKWDKENERYTTNTIPTTKYYRDFRISDERLAEIESLGLSIPEDKIAEGVVKHRMINPVWTKAGRRGISELYASREWFRVFKEFMEDRGTINAAATAFSYMRKIKGGPAALAKVSGKLGGMEVGLDQPTVPGEMRKLTRPVAGALYDATDSIDMKPMNADTGAVNAKEDARLLLMAAGAGVGANIHYFGEGGDANLATAQAMELPMVKGYEDWQKFSENDFNDFFIYVLNKANGEDYTGELEDSEEASWDFPPIITQDVVKFMSAWSQLAQQIAPGNKKVHEIAIRGGLYAMDVPHIDTLMPDIMEEEERLAAERDEMRRAMLEAGPILGGGLPGAGADKNGKGKPGESPDDTRAIAGKPPRERNRFGNRPPRGT